MYDFLHEGLANIGYDSHFLKRAKDGKNDMTTLSTQNHLVREECFLEWVGLLNVLHKHFFISIYLLV